MVTCPWMSPTTVRRSCGERVQMVVLGSGYLSVDVPHHSETVLRGEGADGGVG